MAFTQANLDALETAIITAGIQGYAEINFADRGMRRYSLDELLRLRDAVKVAVNGTAGSTFCRYAKFSKG